MKENTFAEIIKPKINLNDIALSSIQKNTFNEVVAGIKQKTNAISVLLTGTSETIRKTAEVIANELHSDLHKIDLSNIVNKYIGETEKNLNAIFDAAKNGGAVLLFDEADALFGKRTEVKDSHDRYANIEANYLLKKMEDHSGLVILATGKKTNIDEAFIRRIMFHIHFD